MLYNIIMNLIIEKLSSKFNRITVPLTESTHISWFDANPFAIGVKQVYSLYGDWIGFGFLWIIYGDFLYGSKNSVLGITNKKEIKLPFPLTVRTEEVLSFLDAVPKDLVLCFNIPWVRPLIDISCKNS